MIVRTFWLIAAISAMVACTGFYLGLFLLFALDGDESLPGTVIVGALAICAWSICMALLAHMLQDGWRKFSAELSEHRYRREAQLYVLDDERRERREGQ